MSRWQSSGLFPGDKSPAACPVSEVLSPLFFFFFFFFKRSPFATAAPTSRLRRVGLRKTRTFLENGVSGHGLLRFVHLDPNTAPSPGCRPMRPSLNTEPRVPRGPTPCQSLAPKVMASLSGP